MNSQEGINLTHFFKYRNQKFNIDLILFATSSKYIEKNLINLKNQKEINLLIKEKDSNVILTKKSIDDFICYCHRQGININNDNVISLNYLSYEYQVPRLINITDIYIKEHQTELALQYFTFYKDINNEDNERKEDLMALYFLHHINDEKLLSFQVPSLYRILNKFLNNHKNDNDFEKKKIFSVLIPFLFKCLDLHGRKASVLFSGIDLSNCNYEYLYRLLNEYSNVFDFHFINSTMMKTNYELQNEFIQKELKIESSQGSIVKLINEMKDSLKLMNKEIHKLTQENNELKKNLKNQNQDINNKIEKENQEIKKQLIEIQNEFNQQIQKFKDDYLHINEKNQQLIQEITFLKKEINDHKQETKTNIDKYKFDINKENQEIKNSIINTQNENKQQIKKLQSQNEQNISRSEVIQKLTSFKNDITSMINKCSKSFIFNNKNQFSGIISYLRTESNNRIENLINICSSSNDSEYENPKNVTIFEDKSKYFKSADRSNSWISFDFKEHRIIPTDYTIRSFPAGANGNHPKSWAIEVSNDNINWDKIDEQINCSNLRGKSITCSFKIQNQQYKQFRYLRMRQTAPNWYGWDCLIIESFEIFGQLF